MSQFRYFKRDGTIGTGSDAGQWDSNGVPLYLTHPATIEASLIQKINASPS